MITELKSLLERYALGHYVEVEVMPRIAQLGNTYPPELVFNQLPEDIRKEFCKWIREIPVEKTYSIGYIGEDATDEVIIKFKELAG